MIEQDEKYRKMASRGKYRRLYEHLRKMLMFRRKRPSFNLDEVLPVHPTAKWPKGLSLSREDIYGYRV